MESRLTTSSKPRLSEINPCGFRKASTPWKAALPHCTATTRGYARLFRPYAPFSRLPGLFPHGSHMRGRSPPHTAPYDRVCPSRFRVCGFVTSCHGLSWQLVTGLPPFNGRLGTLFHDCLAARARQTRYTSVTRFHAFPAHGAVPRYLSSPCASRVSS